MATMIQNIRTLLWLIFVFVVVIELVVVLQLATGAASLTLGQLALITQNALLLGIFDKVLIVALFGTFVFEKQN